MQLAGNVALVTGAGSGMGAQTARHLAKQGVKVALFDINQQALQQVATETGGEAFVCDVTDAEQVESKVKEALKACGDIRILVNCAGICPAERMVGREGPMPLANFEQVIQVNLIGTFNVMRVVANQMNQLTTAGEDAERGVIINTASVAAFEGQIGQAAYCASKGAIVSMTLPLAREMARYGVRVMAIAPGLVATPLITNMPEEVQQSLAAQVPFPARMGQPEEYARLVQHIIENNYLNGEVIRLDGAIRMQAK